MHLQEVERTRFGWRVVRQLPCAAQHKSRVAPDSSVTGSCVVESTPNDMIAVRSTRPLSPVATNMVKSGTGMSEPFANPTWD